MDDRPSNKIEAMHVRGAIPTSVRVSKACTQTVVFLKKKKEEGSLLKSNVIHHTFIQLWLCDIASKKEQGLE
jgi:hypothetical protein